MDVAVAPYPAPGPGGFYFSPLKVLEYMAAGLPVVASRVATIEEMIEPGRHGFSWNPAAPRRWPGAMEALRRDPDGRARLGAAARARVESRYTWDQVVARILSLAGLPPANIPRSGGPSTLPERRPPMSRPRTLRGALRRLAPVLNRFLPI
jgi:hypothetical protein